MITDEMRREAYSELLEAIATLVQEATDLSFEMKPHRGKDRAQARVLRHLNNKVAEDDRRDARIRRIR